MDKSSTKAGDDEPPRNKGGRPKGSVSKPKQDDEILKELIDTKCKMAELALKNLRLRLQQTRSRDEQLKIAKLLGEIADQIETIDPPEE